MLKIRIDGQVFQCEEGLTIKEAAEKLKINIPIICFHENLTPPGLCRQCVVEVEGARVLQPACITEVRDGMEILTDSSRVKRARKIILEMLAASTDLSEAPELKEQIKAYGADQNRFKELKKDHEDAKIDNPFYVRDYDKCILCGRCVQVCSEDIQFSYALTIGGRGQNSHITTFFNKALPETTCVFCGNCIEVCPTNALIAKKEFV